MEQSASGLDHSLKLRDALLKLRKSRNLPVDAID